VKEMNIEYCFGCNQLKKIAEIHVFVCRYIFGSFCVWGAMEIRAISAAKKGNVAARDGMAFMHK
jgi:hypothetical protein